MLTDGSPSTLSAEGAEPRGARVCRVDPPGHPLFRQATEGDLVSNAEHFSAVLPPDPTELRRLRHDVASWLRNAGIESEARDAVVLATNEAAASAMGSPGDVFVDATHDGSAVTVVVTSADGWTSPDDDLGGQRMRVVREMVENVSFEKQEGRPRLRFQKPL